MSRTADQILQARLREMLPPGVALSDNEDSNVAGYLYPGAGLIADAEALLDALKLEINPGTSTLLLSDYEATLGPDPCGRDALASTVALRQALAWQRWVSVGDNSIPGLIAMAAAVGVTITIDEPEPTICGPAVCGVDVCSQVTDRLVWVVNIQGDGAIAGPEAAICGVGVSGVTVCGDVLAPVIANEFSLLGCPIQKLAPADTTVVFGSILPGQGAGASPVVLGEYALNIDALS